MFFSKLNKPEAQDHPKRLRNKPKKFQICHEISLSIIPFQATTLGFSRPVPTVH
ncbi:hypothetical protein glysoja_028348 [Glycine soja]|uniref:Uncharacterized protein n=1 Tax=Glycine soja TaxID=3848 RepID=A0A0B2R4D3_GLYSO|nr:hypothetical protein glysoja_028348 [Glycine soja]